MGILQDFKLVDSCYKLALHTLVCLLVGGAPANQRPLEWCHWFLTDLEMDCNNYKLDETLSLPREEGYDAHGDNPVLNLDVRPFHHLILPPPHHPMAAPSSTNILAHPGDPAPTPSIPKGPTMKKKPCPTMIKALEPPKEPAFSPISTQKVEVLMPPSGSSLVAPTVSKCKRMQGSAVQPPADIPKVKKSAKSTKTATQQPSIKDMTPMIPKCRTHRSTQKAKAPPDNALVDVGAKKLLLAHPSSSVILSDLGDKGGTLQGVVCNDFSLESESIVAPPTKRVCLVSPEVVSPPLPHAYHPLTGEPLTGLTYVSLTASSECDPPPPVIESSSKSKGKGKARITALPSPITLTPVSPVVETASKQQVASEVVDTTIDARGFHPDIDLQFHEPPSHEALERMKMSLLPTAPESLIKPPFQICSGQEYVYHCHSDPNPYFIQAPLMSVCSKGVSVKSAVVRIVPIGGSEAECMLWSLWNAFYILEQSPMDRGQNKYGHGWNNRSRVFCGLQYNTYSVPLMDSRDMKYGIETGKWNPSDSNKCIGAGWMG
ncbi:hypothetical protein EDD18DRAFT_1112329 [Armillaria luteobubalina]|uniref:Uncharacterized protein n=1 Tax=Armillaria luteobubalina TaxID=153913 RepID=A0AA39PF30_9AGAR|nr:hypothetical protein EDD18DRAFT_1112329 [Armillaria luteobubalina]